MLKKSIKKLIIITLLISSKLIFSQDIFNAIRQGNLEKTKELIEADTSSVNTKNQRGFAPIHFAANFKQTEIIKLLVEKGADPFDKGAINRQPIHWAAAGGSIDILRWLKELNADLNAIDETGKSPLYLAATRGHKEIVNYLLSEKVKIQTEGDGSFDLLYFSITFGHDGIVQEFMNSEFNFKELSEDGTSLLIAAALVGNLNLIEKFVDLGLNLNHQNDFGECALHVAITNNHFEAMKKLLDLGADINIKDFSGQNALTFADKRDDEKFSIFLKDKGLKLPEKFNIKGTYPGFSEPGLTPKLLAPGIISLSDRNERDVMFSPDMKEFYFSRYWAAIRMPMTVQKMTKSGQEWTTPSTASFSGHYNDAECFITPDNKNLYLISRRPYDGTDKTAPWEIWVADRVQDGWDNFRLFDTINLKGCFYPSISKNNDLLYTSAKSNLFLAKLRNGKAEKIQKLGPEINSGGGEYNAMISAKGDYIIFTSHQHENNFGGGDLYISFRKKDNNWTQALNMGPEINTPGLEYCPNLSPDEKYFFFTSNKKGTEDIYWVDASIIDLLKAKVFK